jgi:hypothetical protein
MISMLPKLADKAFILGFFLPTLLFVLVAAQLYYQQPWALAIMATAKEEKGWDSLAYFVLTVWVLSLLLMMVNHTLMQMLEGYYGPLAKIPCFKRGEERRLDDMHRRYTELKNQLAPQGAAGHAEDEATRLFRALFKQFPVNRDFLLPTRFGNAIRAFETYSAVVYGADSIPLWAHLSAVLPKDFQGTLDDARAQVNFVVNICFFAFIIGVAAAVSFACGFDPKSLHNTYTTFTAMLPLLHTSEFWLLCWVVGACVVGRGAYLFSLELIYAWGDAVKAAFDCYLPDLAQKLGYKLPDTGAQRQAFWREISTRSIYWYPMKPEHWEPAEKKPDGE